MSDDFNPSYVPNLSFEEGEQHDDNQHTDNETHLPYPLLRRATPDESGTRPVPNHHDWRDVSQQHHKQSTEGLPTAGSHGTYTLRFRKPRTASHRKPSAAGSPKESKACLRRPSTATSQGLPTATSCFSVDKDDQFGARSTECVIDSQAPVNILEKKRYAQVRKLISHSDNSGLGRMSTIHELSTRAIQQPLNQDRPSPSTTDTQIDLHRYLTEDLREHEQGGTHQLQDCSRRHGTLESYTAPQGLRGMNPEKPSSSSHIDSKAAKCQLTSKLTSSLSGCPMTIKDQSSDRIVPQVNAYVLTLRQSAACPSLPSWTDSQRINSTMNAWFLNIKNLQGKADAPVRNKESRMLLRSLLGLAQQSIGQVGTNTSVTRPGRSSVEFLVSPKLQLNIISKHEDHPSTNHGEQSGAQLLRTVLPMLQKMGIDFVRRMHGIKETSATNDWMSDPELVALQTKLTQLLDGLPRELQFNWPKDDAPPCLFSHSMERHIPVVPLPSSFATDPNDRPQAVYLPATTKATRWVWNRDIVNDDDDDNQDGREWTHRPNTIGVEAPLFLGATNTGCVREAASATVETHAPPEFQKRKKIAKHAPLVQITDGPRRYHVNQGLARVETVDSAMLGKDHTGNDRSHRTTYPRNHHTDQHPHDLDPIQDSSSSETSNPHRADGRAYLAHDLYTHARDVMATTTDPSITTNEISVSDPRPSHTGPDPSGAKRRRKKELPGGR